MRVWMKSQRSPPEGRHGRPYIEFGGQVIVERQFSWPECSRAQGREKRVNLASNPSCLVLMSSHIPAWLSSWLSMSCLSRRGMAQRGAIVPVVTALLAWWSFTNHPVWRGHTVASVIVPCSLGGIVATVREQVATLGPLVAFPDRDAVDLVTEPLNLYKSK
jgi:hypothetical protein